MRFIYLLIFLIFSCFHIAKAFELEKETVQVRLEVEKFAKIEFLDNIHMKKQSSGSYVGTDNFIVKSNTPVHVTVSGTLLELEDNSTPIFVEYSLKKKDADQKSSSPFLSSYEVYAQSAPLELQSLESKEYKGTLTITVSSL